MTPKERFLTAMRPGGVPDRVPVTPDISNHIPCKRTGLPFWDIYFKGKIPLWKAYPSLMDGARAVAMVFAAEESARSGQAVAVPDCTEGGM